ncbi:MAG: hypothetical protein ABMB14_18435 [Myxococcota bacterium]
MSGRDPRPDAGPDGPDAAADGTAGAAAGQNQLYVQFDEAPQAPAEEYILGTPASAPRRTTPSSVDRRSPTPVPGVPALDLQLDAPPEKLVRQPTPASRSRERTPVPAPSVLRKTSTPSHARRRRRSEPRFSVARVMLTLGLVGLASLACAGFVVGVGFAVWQRSHPGEAAAIPDPVPEAPKPPAELDGIPIEHGLRDPSDPTPPPTRPEVPSGTPIPAPTPTPAPPAPK